MTQTCPTVIVESDNEHGCMVINESDYDEKLHTLYGEKSSKQEPTSDELISVEPKKRGRPAKE